MNVRLSAVTICLALIFISASQTALAADSWLQFKFDSRHSGNVPQRVVPDQLGLIGAVPLTDRIYTSPVVADDLIYVVDGSGVAFCIDAKTLQVVWRFATAGGRENCNNVSSPAIVGRFLHFGTIAGRSQWHYGVHCSGNGRRELVDEKTLRHRRLHFDSQRGTTLCWRVQPGRRRDRRTLHLVFGFA